MVEILVVSQAILLVVVLALAVVVFALARQIGVLHERVAPLGALMTDLKRRGLWESTLVIWGGEFGRMPVSQGKDGRDHNPHGFLTWMAGAGIKGGVSYGQTDEIGYKAVVDRVSVHDLHATMLHLLGVDHTRLTYKFQGRHYRLTDVHGKVVSPILA